MFPQLNAPGAQYWVPRVDRPTSNTRVPNAQGKHPPSNIRMLNAQIERPATNMWTPNVRVEHSAARNQVPNAQVDYPTSNVRMPSAVRGGHPTSHVQMPKALLLHDEMISRMYHNPISYSYPPPGLAGYYVNPHQQRFLMTDFPNNNDGGRPFGRPPPPSYGSRTPRLELFKVAQPMFRNVDSFDVGRTDCCPRYADDATESQVQEKTATNALQQITTNYLESPRVCHNDGKVKVLTTKVVYRREPEENLEASDITTMQKNLVDSQKQFASLLKDMTVNPNSKKTTPVKASPAGKASIEKVVQNLYNRERPNATGLKSITPQQRKAEVPKMQNASGMNYQMYPQHFAQANTSREYIQHILIGAKPNPNVEHIAVPNQEYRDGIIAQKQLELLSLKSGNQSLQKKSGKASSTAASQNGLMQPGITSVPPTGQNSRLPPIITALSQNLHIPSGTTTMTQISQNPRTQHGIANTTTKLITSTPLSQNSCTQPLTTTATPISQNSCTQPETLRPTSQNSCTQSGITTLTPLSQNSCIQSGTTTSTPISQNSLIQSGTTTLTPISQNTCTQPGTLTPTRQNSCTQSGTTTLTPLSHDSLIQSRITTLTPISQHSCTQPGTLTTSQNSCTQPGTLTPTSQNSCTQPGTLTPTSQNSRTQPGTLTPTRQNSCTQPGTTTSTPISQNPSCVQASTVQTLSTTMSQNSQPPLDITHATPLQNQNFRIYPETITLTPISQNQNSTMKSAVSTSAQDSLKSCRHPSTSGTPATLTNKKTHPQQVVTNSTPIILSSCKQTTPASLNGQKPCAQSLTNIPLSIARKDSLSHPVITHSAARSGDSPATSGPPATPCSFRQPATPVPTPSLCEQSKTNGSTPDDWDCHTQLGTPTVTATDSLSRAGVNPCTQPGISASTESSQNSRVQPSLGNSIEIGQNYPITFGSMNPRTGQCSQIRSATAKATASSQNCRMEPVTHHPSAIYRYSQISPGIYNPTAIHQNSQIQPGTNYSPTAIYQNSQIQPGMTYPTALSQNSQMQPEKYYNLPANYQNSQIQSKTYYNPTEMYQNPQMQTRMTHPAAVSQNSQIPSRIQNQTTSQSCQTANALTYPSTISPSSGLPQRIANSAAANQSSCSKSGTARPETISQSRQTTHGITYPSTASQSSHTANGITYPSTISQTGHTANGITYPSKVSQSSHTTNGITYPSKVSQSSHTTNGITYPSKVSQSSHTTNGITYPSKISQSSHTANGINDPSTISQSCHTANGINDPSTISQSCHKPPGIAEQAPIQHNSENLKRSATASGSLAAVPSPYKRPRTDIPKPPKRQAKMQNDGSRARGRPVGSKKPPAKVASNVTDANAIEALHMDRRNVDVSVLSVDRNPPPPARLNASDQDAPTRTLGPNVSITLIRPPLLSPKVERGESSQRQIGFADGAAPSRQKFEDAKPASHECDNCARVFLNERTLLEHVTRRCTVPLHDCKLCTAKFRSRQDCGRHRQYYHRTSEAGGMEMGIPLVNFDQEGVVERLMRFGVRSYIPLSQISCDGDGHFAIPIIAASATGSTAQNLKTIGVSTVFSLGPIQELQK